MVEKIGEYKGYKYCILFLEKRGFRNGYISIPETSNYYKRDYQNLPVYSVSLTYGDYLKPLDSYCIGWDHMEDQVYDTESIRKYTSDKKLAETIISMIKLTKATKGKFTTLDDVEQECHEVIDELVKYSK